MSMRTKQAGIAAGHAIRSLGHEAQAIETSCRPHPCVSADCTTLVLAVASDSHAIVFSSEHIVCKENGG